MTASDDNTKGSAAERLNAVSDSLTKCRETAEKNARDNKARWDALAAAEQDRLTQKWVQSDQKGNKPDAKQAKDSLNAKMPSGSLWGLATSATSLAWTSMTQDRVEEGLNHQLEHQVKNPALTDEQKIDMLLSQLESITNNLSRLEEKHQAREDKDLSRLEKKTFDSQAKPPGLQAALNSQSAFVNKDDAGLGAEVTKELHGVKKEESKVQGSNNKEDEEDNKSSLSP